MIPDGNNFILKVTKKGRRLEAKLNFIDLRIDCSKKWDGNWWIIIADIPVELRHRSDYFREKLKEIKFCPLQRTVWVFPHDPRDEVEFVAAYFGLERYVTSMKVSEMDKEDEKKVKQFFKERGVLGWLR